MRALVRSILILIVLLHIVAMGFAAYGLYVLIWFAGHVLHPFA